MPERGSLFRRYGPMPLLRGPPRDAARPAPPLRWRRTLALLWQHLSAYRLRLLGVGAALVANAALILLAPYLLGLAVDAVLFERDAKAAWPLIAGLGATWLAQLAATLLQAHWMIGIAQRSVADIRDRLLAHLHALPLHWFAGRSRGETVSRLTNDLDNLGQSLGQALLRIGTSALVFAGMLAVMFRLQPLLALASLVVVPTMYFGMRWINARAPLLFHRQQRDLGELAGYVDEALSLHTAIKAFDGERWAVDEFERRNRRLHVSAYWAQTYSGFMSKIMYLCDNLSFALIAAGGGFMALYGLVTVGTIVTFCEYTRQFSRQLNQVSTQVAQLLAALAGAARAFEVLDAPVEDDGGLELHEVRGDIRFEAVGFAYPGGPPVLAEVDLHVAPGRTLALVGPTGAGKSTVVQLLARAHDVGAGRILIDGRDLRDVRRRSLRRHLGFVLQEPLLFGLSVRENVRYGRPGAGDAEVERACRLADAHAFIEALPEGYDTRLAQDDEQLSHGQKQLLTIARAILADPRVLVLDEATSSIDSLTESRIQQALAALMRGRTCIVIAHRLDTILRADRIAVIDRGRVVEQGTHASLLASGGLYAALYRQQVREDGARS